MANNPASSPHLWQELMDLLPMYPQICQCTTIVIHPKLGVCKPSILLVYDYCNTYRKRCSAESKKCGWQTTPPARHIYGRSWWICFPCLHKSVCVQPLKYIKKLGVRKPSIQSNARTRTFVHSYICTFARRTFMLNNAHTGTWTDWRTHDIRLKV